jgi:hypothetical protein
LTAPQGARTLRFTLLSISCTVKKSKGGLHREHLFDQRLLKTARVFGSQRRPGAELLSALGCQELPLAANDDMGRGWPARLAAACKRSRAFLTGPGMT